MLKKILLKLLANKPIKISIDSDKDGVKAFYAEINLSDVLDELEVTNSRVPPGCKQTT